MRNTIVNVIPKTNLPTIFIPPTLPSKKQAVTLARHRPPTNPNILSLCLCLIMYNNGCGYVILMSLGWLKNQKKNSQHIPNHVSKPV